MWFGGGFSGHLFYGRYQKSIIFCGETLDLPIKSFKQNTMSRKSTYLQCNPSLMKCVCVRSNTRLDTSIQKSISPYFHLQLYKLLSTSHTYKKVPIFHNNTACFFIRLISWDSYERINYIWIFKECIFAYELRLKSVLRFVSGVCGTIEPASTRIYSWLWWSRCWSAWRCT